MRLAKAISNQGYCSRRDAEKLIIQGKIRVNDQIVQQCQTLVSEQDKIEVDNYQNLTTSARLWLYHKPKGVISTHKDPQGRKTVFETFPIKLNYHVVSVGRLDLNSEGLLLITNSKSLAHMLEHPENNFERVYKVRVFGKLTDEIFKITRGITIDGIRYKPIKLKILQEGINNWCQMTLSEGKNREIRKIFEHFGLIVNRLIRTDYGPFSLGNLEVGQAQEIPTNKIKLFIESKC